MAPFRRGCPPPSPPAGRRILAATRADDLPFFASEAFRRTLLSEDGFNDFWEQETDQFWWMLDQILEDNQPATTGDRRSGALLGAGQDALAGDLGTDWSDGLTADLVFVVGDTPTAETNPT